MIAFAYGAVHAAGPGHGKALVMSFIAPRNPSLGSGLFFLGLALAANISLGMATTISLFVLLVVSGKAGTSQHSAPRTY